MTIISLAATLGTGYGLSLYPKIEASSPSDTDTRGYVCMGIYLVQKTQPSLNVPVYTKTGTIKTTLSVALDGTPEGLVSAVWEMRSLLMSSSVLLGQQPIDVIAEIRQNPANGYKEVYVTFRVICPFSTVITWALGSFSGALPWIVYQPLGYLLPGSGFNRTVYMTVPNDDYLYGNSSTPIILGQTRTGLYGNYNLGSKVITREMVTTTVVSDEPSWDVTVTFAGDYGVYTYAPFTPESYYADYYAPATVVPPVVVVSPTPIAEIVPIPPPLPIEPIVPVVQPVIVDDAVLRQQMTFLVTVVQNLDAYVRNVLPSVAKWGDIAALNSNLGSLNNNIVQSGNNDISIADYSIALLRETQAEQLASRVSVARRVGELAAVGVAVQLLTAR